MTIQAIYDAVVARDKAAVEANIQTALTEGRDVTEILNEGLIRAMEEVGEQFSAGTIFVPEMLMAALAMKAGMKLLQPHLASDNSQSKGTVIIGTVKGDLHDIGKNLVAMMLEGAGFEVIDLGVDVDSAVFIETAGTRQANLVALSALLTTTMPAMERTITALREAGLKIPVIIGGAPVTEAYARQIGADGYGIDAPRAVKLAKQLVAAA
ncbi:corrinoid protein [Desulfofustis glycolicus]|uniref:B12 binding domain-containing protein n=1 Tax=Desulfofustis glycolicus DSM 9705 TaxID=1121409 RepID=A0A1M5ULR5_9BACT|nr:corrinoid protein [Desulfofustis glycolicus]MCB2217427.1 corrinoid protein [Desulfobulbaceae bacterium]SHH63818.1 B12 binding domain-containing protein [Desulfofustis glycolicus DSM 9705]